MAPSSTEMHNWLLGPSLSHYLQARSKGPPPDADALNTTDLQDTKKLLKEHLLSAIFECALDSFGDAATPAVSQAVAEPSGAMTAGPTGYYIYAITRLNSDLRLAERGVDPTYPIYRYPFGKAQALISKVSLAEFGERVLQVNLKDGVWFQETTEKHNRVLAAARSQGAIVAMRVCTICDSHEGLKAFLDEHYGEFLDALGFDDGKQEWELKVQYNERKLRLLTEKASNRVRALQAQMAGKPAGDVSTLQNEVEHVIAEETRAVCRACIRHSNGTLATLAAGTTVLPLSNVRAENGRRLILYTAYSLDSANVAAFREQIEQLHKAYESLGFEYVLEGPHPPSRVRPGEARPEASMPSEPTRTMIPS